MNKMKCSTIGFGVGIALFGAGCVVHEPHHARVYAPGPTVYVDNGGPDDYVYYPRYQVYYSNNRRQYIYQDGHSWLAYPEPPHVSANVLLASPSVRLDFHDSPSNHHKRVVRQYPKNWSPKWHRD